MSEKKTNRKYSITKTGSFAVIAAILIVAAGISTANQTSGHKDAAAPAGTDLKRQANVKPIYVPGQVIVKLRESQANIGLFSQPEFGSDQAVLHRLQREYGLYIERPVFKGTRWRLEHQDITDSRAQRQAHLASMAGPTVAAKRSMNADLSRFYMLKTDRNVRGMCTELANDPDVAYAQPNYIYESCAEPNDPEFPDQYAHQLIQMSDAWDISTGSHDIVVAVLDTGVDVNHPDLKDNIWLNADEIPNNDLDDDNNGYVDDVSGWNFEEDSNNVMPDFESYDSIVSHGTQVSGVIAAMGNNNLGVCGVNWQGSIMALRLSIEVTSAEVAEALDYAAANGAHVANMSFGSDEFGPEGDPLVKTAIDNAFARGVLLVASAGNDDTSVPNYPAAYYNVMAVASTNGEDIKTGHSSFGQWVDITAPGTDIVTTDLYNEYIATAGTSFSAPYVAAVGALVLAYCPELTHIEVRAILENTTDPVFYGDVDPLQGYIGTGRVNAYEALMAADKRLPLGEIIAPMPHQTFASDGNDIPLELFVHGDSYRLEYSIYGRGEWIVLGEGEPPIDPNGIVHLSLPNPGAGAFDLRLNVTTDGTIHTDRKIFGIKLGTEIAPWPLPEIPEDPEEFTEMYIGSPLCLDVDGDGRKEIVEASITADDYYWYVGSISIWKDDGTALDGWPVALVADLWSSMIASGLAVGDIDGDGDYEIVVVDDYNVMATALHVESGRTVKGWPVEVGGYWYAYIIGSPVLADLDGDGDSEIIVALDEESRESDGLFAIQGDGTFLWQRRYTTEGPISVADFDGDGDVEIALCGYGPGITRVYTFILDHNGQQINKWRGGSKKGTAVADLDNDGVTELVFCTEDGVMAVHVDGSTLWTAKVRGPLGDEGALSVGDVDSDGLSEVYVNSYIEEDGFAYTLLYAFDHEGEELTDAGFPKMLMGYPGYCSPLIGDVDGDGQKELVVASAGAPVMAWEHDGSTTLGFPMLDLSAEASTCPTLEDLDQDGDLEMIINGYDLQFHVIDLPGAYDPALTDWGMSRRDPQNSGWVFPIPTLNPISVPDQIEPGQILEFQLTTSNPANQQTRLSVGNLPEGAYYIPDTQTVVWKPTADQAPYTYTFSFLVTDGIRQHSQSASVTVVQNAIYWADMDTDPNWLLDDGWAWGRPAGAGSWNGDPNSGYTGENVIGFELEGDYANNMTETHYATTGAINCTGYKNVRLSFRRWLGVESPYDYADIQVSNDGTNWINLWTTGLSHISDNAWQAVDYAVPPSVGDGQATVYFRWGIGPTDESVTYPGWNIDDVRVTGDLIE